MTSIKQKVLAGAAAAVVAVGGGLAVANVGSGDTASATQGGGPPSGQMGGPGGRQDLGALAEDLGVTEAQLEAAMQQQRGSAGGGPEGLAADLAEALGLETSAVQEALEANRPDGAPSGGQDQPAAPSATAPPSGTTTTS